jgi:hypothetical protein
MSLTVNAKSYTADGYSNNAVSYVGPAHTVSVKDDLRVGRVLPKPTSIFSGVARQSFKLTRTHTLTGALTTVGDSISDFSTSIPVGASAADIELICTDLGAFIASAAFKTMLTGQIISG